MLMVDEKRLERLAEYYDTRDISEEIEKAELEQHAPVDNVMIVSSIRLPKPLMDRVREAALEEGVKPTALMRRWIEEGLAQSERAADQGTERLDHLSALLHQVVREELEEAGLR